jgi:predicted dithiol-disulfide oxidoreductase (DUF899 family)
VISDSGSSSKLTVNCALHGKKRIAAVCDHVVLQLRDKIPRGANWKYFRDEDDFEVFCDSCSELIAKFDGSLPDEIKSQVGLQIICEACMDEVLMLNDQTRLN